MTERLTLEHFRALADAYGGVVARWPDRYREAAMAMASEPSAVSALDQASALDITLDAWRVPTATLALRARVIGDAPTASAGFGVRVRLWWSGIGIAAALAGAVAGTAAAAVITPVDVAPESSTSFGDVAGLEA